MTIDTLVFEKKLHGARIAGLCKGELRELEIVEESKAGEGMIFLGRVTHKVELANNRAGYFVNIGGYRDAFLNAEEPGLEELKACEGQELIVQVAQEQRAEKGARLTRAIQIVGENLVYCPFRMTVEVSGKIEDKAKAEEYAELAVENTTGQEGWIIRTSAVKASQERLIAEMEELRGEYEEVLSAAKKCKAPALLKGKKNPLFDYISKNSGSLRRIAVNVRGIQEEITRRFGDNLIIEILPDSFGYYGLEDAISEALQKTVKLRSGGRITIEETKACVAIDVDSGDDNGQGNLGRLNMEAAAEIAKQIILRNLSGKIIIDFAGVSDYRYLKNAVELLEEEMRHDYVKNTVYGLSRGGNVEIVRMRRRPSLRDLLTEECQSCQGTGRCEK